MLRTFGIGLVFAVLALASGCSEKTAAVSIEGTWTLVSHESWGKIMTVVRMPIELVRSFCLNVSSITPGAVPVLVLDCVAALFDQGQLHQTQVNQFLRLIPQASRQAALIRWAADRPMPRFRVRRPLLSAAAACTEGVTT